MKRKISLINFAIAISLLFSTVAFATSDQDIPVGGSGQIVMTGTIEPTILSVTMPTTAPFHISNNLTAQNKVISPRISVKNNSNVPIQVDVEYTQVNLTGLKNVTWSNTGTVSDRQIAIGLREEEERNVMPTDLNYTKWLRSNTYQNTKILTVDEFKEGAMYIVGTMGKLVSEDGTFKVIPNFVVSRASTN